MIFIFIAWLQCISIPVNGPLELPIPQSKEVKESYLPSDLRLKVDSLAWKSWQEELENSYVETEDISFRISWAAVELLIGDAGLALMVLEPLQITYPANHDVQLLLSIAYEKTGRYRKALASAERFYKLKPNGCARTSKLHIKWLKIASDPLAGPEKIINMRADDYLEDYRRTQANPKNLEGWDGAKSDIWNFLRQRSVLFQQPHPYMARLMVDMGDYHYLTGDGEGAGRWYQEALAWNSELSTLIDSRNALLKKSKIGLITWLVIGGVIGLIAVVVISRIKPTSPNA